MQEIIFVTIILFVWGILSLGIGHSILRKLSWQANDAVSISIAYLLGFAVLAYSLVLLGLIKLFTLPAVSIVGVIYVVLFGRGGLRQFWQFVISSVHLSKNIWRTHRWLIVPLLAVAVFVLVNYLASFAPPTARDEISYHLPEARALVSSQSLDFLTNAKNFYTNLPLLLEVVYAWGILVSGYSLAHVMHYSIWLAFCLFIFGWLYEYFGRTTATWSIVGLFLLTQVVTTATSGLVDTAYMVLEIMSVCLFITWFHSKQNTTLALAGIMIGFALSIKYSPLFTASLLAVFIAGVSFPRRQWRPFIWFVLPVVLVGGFWYIKNFIVYFNPTYPLLFGHADYGEAEYLSLIAAIQDFVVPRTLWNYVQIPVTFYLAWTKSDYPLLSLSYQPQSLIVLFSLASLPWLIALKRARLVVLILFSYMIVYSLYWFFIATHQVRFLDTITTVLLLLAVIAITRLPRYWKYVPVAILFIAIIGIGLRYDIRSYLLHVIDAAIAQRWMRKNEIYYLIDHMSKKDYLESHFGCGVLALDYLDTTNPNVKVLDNWTAWHDHQFKFYDQHSRFISFPPDLPVTDVNSFIQSNGIGYIYFDTRAKNDFANSTDPFFREHYRARSNQEQQLLDGATLVFESTTCQLHRLR